MLTQAHVHTLAAVESEVTRQLEVPADSSHTRNGIQSEIDTTSPAKHDEMQGLFPLYQIVYYNITIIFLLSLKNIRVGLSSRRMHLS